jgi:hypothetical protein
MPTASDRTESRHLWLERLVLMLSAAVYLYVCQSQAPNGDGSIYIRMVESGTILWNPNHLYFEPTAFFAHWLVQTLHLGWSIFGTLKVVAGVSAVVTIGLFHAALSSLPGASASVRVLAAAGCFLSAHFLSMAIAEEFFMIQMPWLAMAFVLGVRWATGRIPPERERAAWIGMGALVAVATSFMISNIVLIACLGLAAIVARPGERSSRLGRLVSVWGAAAAVGLPLFLGTYLVTARGNTLAQWLTSYGGRAENATNELFGTQWTPTGIAISAARLVWGSASSLIDLGGLGMVAKIAVFRQPLEYLPDYVAIGYAVSLFAVLAVLLGPLLWWLIRRGRRQPTARFLLCWMAAYLLFNFYWGDTGDQFWFQNLLPIWTLLAMFATDVRVEAGPAGVHRWRTAAVALLVVLLAAANTAAVVAPRAFADLDTKRQAYASLLRDGDLIVMPGWDDLWWMRLSDDTAHERILLMDLALKPADDFAAMRALPARLEQHLATGRRVVVARLFDLDRTVRPWEQLARLRWPRKRIQALLDGFATQPIGEVDGVVFRTLTARPGADQTRPREVPTKPAP